MIIIQVIKHRFEDNKDSDFNISVRTFSDTESKVNKIELSPSLKDLCIVAISEKSIELDIEVDDIEHIIIEHKNFSLIIEKVIYIKRDEYDYVFLGELKYKKRGE